MHDYQEDIQTALDLITEFGTQVRIGGETAYAAFVAKKQDALGNISGAGGTVLSTMKMEKVALVAGTLRTPPQVGGTIISSRTTWLITAVEEVAPAEVVVLYKLEVSR